MSTRHTSPIQITAGGYQLGQEKTPKKIPETPQICTTLGDTLAPFIEDILLYGGPLLLYVILAQYKR